MYVLVYVYMYMYIRVAMADCSGCKKLRQELQRTQNNAYNIIKQRGAHLSDGKTHDELSTEFKDFFDFAVYDTTEFLHKEHSVKEDEARQFLCKILQQTYTSCRDRILKKMEQSLRRILTVEDEPTSKSEDLFDACRAYGLLLHATGVIDSSEHEEISKEVCNTQILSDDKQKLPEIQMFARDAAHLSWSLLTTVPPMVCAEPPKGFKPNVKWYEEEVEAGDSSLVDDHELVYYRPALFRSYAGHVAREARVGSRRCEQAIEQDGKKTQLNEASEKAKANEEEANVTQMKEEKVNDKAKVNIKAKELDEDTNPQKASTHETVNPIISESNPQLTATQLETIDVPSEQQNTEIMVPPKHVHVEVNLKYSVTRINSSKPVRAARLNMLDARGQPVSEIMPTQPSHITKEEVEATQLIEQEFPPSDSHAWRCATDSEPTSIGSTQHNPKSHSCVPCCKRSDTDTNEYRSRTSPQSRRKEMHTESTSTEIVSSRSAEFDSRRDVVQRKIKAVGSPVRIEYRKSANLSSHSNKNKSYPV